MLPETVRFDYDGLGDPKLAASLRGRAARIQGSLQQSVLAIVEAGRELEAAWQELGRSRLYSQWVWAEFGMTDRHARRFRSVARLLDNFFGDESESLSKMAAENTALWALTEERMPEPARIAALQQMGEGLFLTKRIVENIAAAVDEAAATAEYLEHASVAVTALALRHAVSPEAIPALTRLEQQQPDRFAEVMASGCIEREDGEQILIGEANGREIDTYGGLHRTEDWRVRQELREGNDVAEETAEVNRLVAVWRPDFSDLEAITTGGGRLLFVVAAFGDPVVSNDSRLVPASRLNGSPAWLDRVVQICQGHEEGDVL